ncbi:MAG: cell envelope integrity protein TolA [Chitinophagaceae bacterium]|nr:cell envelope integrity protein TolA [Chitinophagaceae bacterium]
MALISTALQAQPKLDFELKKPKEFQERKLGSEKNADKDFTLVRRFFQNTYTHYNYYFNANTLINQIIENASLAHRDDFTELLPYYPWSVEQTSQSADIDSILATCTAGILLHDLRNNWIDNMYLLMGKAYYLNQNFDSATMAFQYLNYSFAPKEKGGFDKPIGSNDDEKSNAFTIMSKEKKSYIGSRPPSRNDGFIWEIRNLTDQQNYLDASSLIIILRNDPNFPERLSPQLNEVTGYLFYKLSMWDSAAVYLEKAMPMAANPSDKARRWFLTAQLYQLSGDYQKSAAAYAKCLGLVTDLVMDVYARLNSIRLRKNEDPKIIDQNISDLLAMAKKSKYAEYRDIIYYAAAMVEIERNGLAAASQYLEKSIAANTTNTQQRTLSQFALGNVFFAQKNYGKAGPPYDSLQINQLKRDDSQMVAFRRPPCLQIYDAEKMVFLQDSLMALADMQENERTAIVKKIASKLRKERGLGDESEENMGAVSKSAFGDDNTKDLFAIPAGGKWYFADPNLRANGFNSFKERWGGRGNQDNWRRSSSLGTQMSKLPDFNNNTGDPDAMPVSPEVFEETFDSTDISFDNLYSRIPLSPERRAKAEDLAIQALFRKATALHEMLEDYEEAIKVYEEILKRGAKGEIAAKTMFGLVHCYNMTGQTAKAKALSSKMETEYPDEVSKINAPLTDERTALEDSTYEHIYDLFISGEFASALKEKEKADSTIGKGYWKPQLLYIQSVYHIQQREDSLAILQLNNLANQFKGHGLAEKATRMIDVLKRRKEIEDYLTKLDIKRAEEDQMDSSLLRPSAPVIAVIPNAAPVDSAANALALKEAAEKAEKLKEEKEAWEKQEAERLALEAEEAKKAEAKRLADEKAAAEKAEADRIAAEKAAAEKAEAERLAAEKALAEKQAAEKAAFEKAEAERLAAEKEKAEKELAEKIAAEKAAAEKELAEKLAAEKAKAEKELAEKQAKEKEALEKDAANRAEAEKALAEKQAKEKEALEKEIAEKERLEKEKAEKELAEKQAAEKAKAEKELADKIAADKLQAEKEMAEKQAKEKAEAEKLANEKIAAEKLAAEKREAERKAAEDKARAEKEAAEKAALAKQNMVDNVTILPPKTESPFKIKPNEKQVVAIILERIDPAYVNEISYTLTHSSLLNRDGDDITVNKKKIRDNLWLVELTSASFMNMQAAYDYIKYMKPILQNDLVTWLDSSKYSFITISEANLKELEKSQDAQLYLKVLREAVPGKF